MIFSRVAGVLIAVFATTLGACAATVRPGLSTLLIKQGEPSASYDDPATKREKTVAREGVADPLSGQPMRERSDPGNALEKADKGLANALAGLSSSDTAPNQLRVAAEYRRLRVLDKAYDHATLALKRNRRSADAFEQRAQIWREWGVPQLGIGDAHRAVFWAPRSHSAHNTLGSLLQSIGQMEAARQEYLAAVDLDPGAAYAWSNLCYLSLVTGHAERAVIECDTALRQSPGLRAALNNRALSHAVAGRLEEATEELLGAAGSPADGAFNVGMLYLALGRYHMAEASFRTATNMRPNFSAAQTRRRQAAKLAAREHP